jgi:hypothetical protein
MPLTIETRDLRRAPREYLAEAQTDEQRADAIQKYIVNGLGNCAVQPYLAANSVRQCGRVMETAYGTEAEKALAMAKLMRAEGLQAQAVVAFPAAQGVMTIRNVVEYMVQCNGKFYSVKTLGEAQLSKQTAHYSLYDLAGNKIELPESYAEYKLLNRINVSANEMETSADYTILNEGKEKTVKITETNVIQWLDGYAMIALPAKPSIYNVAQRLKLDKLSKERYAPIAIPCKLRAAAVRSENLHKLLAGYAAIYDDRIKADGRLTFDDISRMAKELMQKEPGNDQLLRHHIAYRMGGRLSHWMLDEFQDTSESQFRTLTPLLKRLEGRGLLTRRRSDADERAVIVSLTDEGRALRTQALEVPRCIAGRIAFDPAEGLQLKQLLDKLLSVLSE